VLTIHLGTPEGNQDDYQIVKIEKIIIYLPKEINLKNERLNISLAKLFKWKKLTLEKSKIKK
jgi:hypothetical protein